MIEITEGARVLDVGTGWLGSSLIPAAKKVGEYGQVIGIDISKDSIRDTSFKIQEQGLSNTKVVEMDANQLNFQNDDFDFVISGFIGWARTFDFEKHKFRDQKSKIEELFRVLKFGGNIGLSSWEFQGDNEWMGTLVGKYLPEEISEVFGKGKAIPKLYSKENVEGMQKLLHLIGFKNIKVFKERYTLFFQDGEEYWEQMQRLGWSYYLKKLPTAKQEKLKEYVFKDLQGLMDNDGIKFEREVIFAFGKK
ncbi:MAG: class I SAM-dependent methyltransferase [Candidatus Kariarchaeaceae archaeon]